MSTPWNTVWWKPGTPSSPSQATGNPPPRPSQWLLDHTALVNERIRNGEVGGFEVDVERQYKFAIRGNPANLKRSQGETRNTRR